MGKKLETEPGDPEQQQQQQAEKIPKKPKQPKNKKKPEENKEGEEPKMDDNSNNNNINNIENINNNINFNNNNNNVITDINTNNNINISTVYAAINNTNPNNPNIVNNNNNADGGSEQDQQKKSNAGRPKKNNVSINDLDFQFVTVNYNIAAFSVQFRKQVMCYNNGQGQDNYSFNQKFEKYGRKSNKNHFDKERLDELENELNQKRREYQNDDIKMRLFTFISNVKLHLEEYYDTEEQKKKEFDVIDRLFDQICVSSEVNFDEIQIPQPDLSTVVLPSFWKTIADIMLQEKQNKIDKSFLDLLD